MTDIKSKIDDNIQLNILDKNSNVKRMLEEALTYGYHAAKDEFKGISSSD